MAGDTNDGESSNSSKAKTVACESAKDIPYFTPLQNPPAGSGVGDNVPKLFTPLRLRGLELQNRIMLSPLCQYSADNGHLTDWHLTHLGGIIQRGPGLTMVEATAVAAAGRITPQDSGLYLESQIEPLKRIVTFAHSQNQKIAIQLALSIICDNITKDYKEFDLVSYAAENFMKHLGDIRLSHTEDSDKQMILKLLYRLFHEEERLRALLKAAEKPDEERMSDRGYKRFFHTWIVTSKYTQVVRRWFRKVDEIKVSIFESSELEWIRKAGLSAKELLRPLALLCAHLWQAETGPEDPRISASKPHAIGVDINKSEVDITTTLWLENTLASKTVGGWPDEVIAPSAISFDGVLATPKAMSLEDIERFKQDFARSVKFALEAGFDAIEIHSAHGYLLHSFLSPVSNHRPESDPYSGHSFETRVKLLLEVVKLTRGIIPETMPFLVRVSGSDFLDYEGSEFTNSWKETDTVRLAPLLEEAGVDLLDISGGGISPKQKIPNNGKPGYQSPIARAVKRELSKSGKGRMLVGTVGGIKTADVAAKLLADEIGDDALDLIIVGRAFQKNPGLVWAWAEELEVEVRLANQIRWPIKGRHVVDKK